MSEDDVEYYSERAQTELELASMVPDPRAAQVHLAFARAYYKRLAEHHDPSACWGALRPHRMDLGEITVTH